MGLQGIKSCLITGTLAKAFLFCCASKQGFLRNLIILEEKYITF